MRPSMTTPRDPSAEDETGIDALEAQLEAADAAEAPAIAERLADELGSMLADDDPLETPEQGS